MFPVVCSLKHGCNAGLETLHEMKAISKVLSKSTSVNNKNIFRKAIQISNSHPSRGAAFDREGIF